MQSGQDVIQFPEVVAPMLTTLVDHIEEIYLKSMEANPDAIIVINDQGKMIVINRQAEFMFGYARNEILMQEIEILIPNELKEKHIDHRNSYVEDPKIREMGTGKMLYGLHKSGRKFKVQIKLAPMIITDVGLHILAVVRKVS